MKAAVLEAVGKLVVRQVAEPELGPNDVAVRVAACGVCGTDVKLYHGEYTARVPVVLGHEFAGEVVRVGERVRYLKEGDRVTVDPNESCGECEWCRSGRPTFCSDLAAYGVLRDGAFAELCVVGAKGAYKLPDALGYEEAAFCEPVSCAVHCIDRADIQPGDAVAIIGAGPMGQILTQLARRAGAAQLIVVSRSQWKLELARQFGATHTIAAAGDEHVADAIEKLTDRLGVHVAIEAVGKPQTLQLAMRVARRGGRVVIFGFAPEGQTAALAPFDILSKELTILGSWVNPYTFRRALDALACGLVDVRPLTSRRVQLAQVLDAIKLMEQKPDGFVKALVVF